MRTDLTDKVFGRLTVLEFAERAKDHHALWLCQCSCGNTKVISGNSLQQGRTKSCGCLDKEAHVQRPNRTDHGFSHHRLYRIWKAMKNRCLNPNSPDYQKYYGGRGITICDSWKNNFWRFYNWTILNGYNDNLSIDRIDPNGNYEPSNCRWATPEEQRRNQRRNLKGGVSHQES